MKTTKQSIMLVALLFVAAFVMSADNPYIAVADCSPGPGVPGPMNELTCKQTLQTTNGTVYTDVSALCWNTNNLFLSSGATAVNCGYTIGMGSTSEAFIGAIITHSFVSNCYPDFAASWSCTQNYYSIAEGGCLADCSGAQGGGDIP